MRIAILLMLFIAVSGCASRLPPEQRVASWENWELCHRLADFVFKGQSQWLWHSAQAITDRGLNNDARCKSVYDARMQEYVRKYQKPDLSISFGQAVNSNAAFNEVAPSSP